MSGNIVVPDQSISLQLPGTMNRFQGQVSILVCVPPGGKPGVGEVVGGLRLQNIDEKTMFRRRAVGLWSCRCSGFPGSIADGLAPVDAGPPLLEGLRSSRGAVGCTTWLMVSLRSMRALFCSGLKVWCNLSFGVFVVEVSLSVAVPGRSAVVGAVVVASAESGFTQGSSSSCSLSEPSS